MLAIPLVVFGFARAFELQVQSRAAAEVRETTTAVPLREDVGLGDGASWNPPPYFDYDCDRLPTSEWDRVYRWAEENVVLRHKSPDKKLDLKLRPEFASLLESTSSTPVESMECPIGVLYLRVLHFYTVMGESNSDTLENLELGIQELLVNFPMFAIALSRWPVFHVLAHLQVGHPDLQQGYCTGIRGVLDWDWLRQAAHRWMFLQTQYGADKDDFSEETSSLEQSISQMFSTVLSKAENHYRAYQECPFGFYFLSASQLVAAAWKDTQNLPSYNELMNDVFRQVKFVTIAGCGWPIFAMLRMFADINKGHWFFDGGDRKYLRGYSDWNLRRDELSPLLPRSLDFLTPKWRLAAERTVEDLANLGSESFAAVVRWMVATREHEEGPLRPILRNLVDAALAVAQASRHQPQGERRLVYVVLLYGSKWADILVRLAGRLKQLAVRYPLFAISIGEEASAVCRKLSQEGTGIVDGEASQKVVCWTPDSPSQVHRFTAIHALLHLGVDVIYLDMDTFLLRDPTEAILSRASTYDALFASHADADCINIGVFFLRATASTAIWFSQFVAWYHDHPFEIDQRGLHVFLGLPAKQLSIAYPPKDLVKIRGSILDDVNEVVIGDIGWHGDLSKILIFHWCHMPIGIKASEIRRAYEAAEAADRHGLPLSLAMSASVRAHPDSGWMPVLIFRKILERYRRSAPPAREPCW